MRRWAADLLPFLEAAAVVLIAHAAAAQAALPVLGVLVGPFGAVLLALGAFVSLSRLVRGERRRQPPGRVPLFLFSATAFVALGLHYTAGLQASGDEPHYLLMAQSLWKEGDLDLRDNLERQDYIDYTPGPLTPHYAAPRRDGRAFPAHSPGLPALLAPVYALGGRRACVVLLAVLAAVLGLQVRALALQLSMDGWAAFWAWAAALGPPVAFYSFHIYTEVPSALALAVGLRLAMSAGGVTSAAAAALAASALPWLHVKMIPAALALGLLGLWRYRGRSRAAFAAVAGLMAIGFLAYYAWVFGRPTPLAIYGGVPKDATGVPAVAAIGLLLDRSFGLLPHAPLFLLGVAGLPALLRRPWRESLPHLLVGAAVLTPVLTWRMWWGGQCPPARFLVPLVPLLALLVAARLADSARGLARWRIPLLALASALVVFMAARPAERLFLNRADRPTRVWAALGGATPVERYLPSLVAAEPGDLRTAAVWVGALALLLALDRLAGKREGIDRLFRGLELPLALFLALGTAVDLWAR